MTAASLIIHQDLQLAPFTTLKIGGPARFFARVETEQQVLGAFEFAERKSLYVFILGGGSNILVSDSGFEGLVVHVALKGTTLREPEADQALQKPARSKGESMQKPAREQGRDPLAEHYALTDVRASAKNAPADEWASASSIITAAAGEDWDRFVGHCVSQNLAGIECLSGIPGSIGGTPVQNVGAYGQEVSETIVSVRCFDRLEKTIVELSNADCGFSYRKSIFNTTERERYVVLSVTYSLTRGGPPKIVYKDLKEIFGENVPTLAETREAVLKIRRAKSMVIDETDPNSRSAGSFFKNPIVESDLLGSIGRAAGTDAVPNFPAGVSKVKVPAAWLIEQAGFHKGYRLGNAGISTKHSLALVNLGGAAAAEIIALKGLIEKKVQDKFGIMLQPEPVFVGF